MQRGSPPSCGSEKLSVTAHPGMGWRLPSRGSLSAVTPLNLVFMIQAPCTNSNWREMFALMQTNWMPCSPVSEQSG